MIREEDVEQIHAIEKACFAMPWSEASILHDVKDNPAARWVVLDGGEGRVLAYAGLWLVIDEGHVLNVAVHPDARKQGYGHGIMQELIRIAKAEGMRLMTLEVRRSNLAAQKLYNDRGLLDVGNRKRYYEDNREDALIMYMDLDQDDWQSAADAE